MADIQFALAISKAAPYHRLLKIVDGVASHDASFPDHASPVPLITADFSPDGIYVLAATDTSGTTPFRMWKRQDEEFTPLTTANGGTLAVAETVAELRWLTDTHVVAVGQTAGCWFGVLDRATDQITWTRFRTDTGYQTVAIAPGGEYFACGRESASVYFRNWKRTGDTVAEYAMASNPSVGFLKSRFNKHDMMAAIRYGTSYIHVQPANWAGNAYFTGGAYVNFPAAMQPSTDTGMARAPLDWTKDGTCIVYGIGATPYLGVMFSANIAFPVSFIRSNFVLGSALAAAPLAVRAIKDKEFFVAVNSATATTGRVRKFDLNADGDFVEDASVATIFSAWNAIFTDVAVSNAIVVSSVPVQMYDSSIEDIVSGAVDLTNLKIALMSNAAAFDADHTTLAQVLAGNEVYGSSWPQGGIATSDGLYEKFGTGADYALRIPIPSLNMADPGSFTFRKAVIYDDSHTDKKPLGFLTFDTDKLVEQYDRMQFSSTNARFAIFSLSDE